jgi:hypothetical protein
MRKFITIAIITILLSSFRPGEPIATLTCKSASGRTTFSAELPSCSYLGNAAFSIDGYKLSFSPDDKSHIIFDPENKVLTIYLESKSDEPKSHKFLKFWALPSSYKKVNSNKGPGSEFHDVYEFHAKLFATEPRKTNELNTKTIELICTLDYEL